MERDNILFPVIEYYLGCMIDSVIEDGDVLFFTTEWGMGELYKNPSGDWEIYLGSDKISEIEGKVFNILRSSQKTADFQKYYNDLRSLTHEALCEKSQALVNDVIESLEMMILNEKVVVTKPLNMGRHFIFPMDGLKEIVCLN